MSLTLAKLSDLKAGYSPSIRVGEIPFAVARQLRLLNHNVYLSASSLTHILRDHPDIDLFTLLELPFAIGQGLLVQERRKPHIILSCYQSSVHQRRFIVAMKTAANGTETWVSSFYKSRARQTRSVLNRGNILKPHD